MNICIISNKYPNKYEPNVLVFLQQLVWQFADLGHKCYVICPMAANLHPEYLKLEKISVEKSFKDNNVVVYRPKYFSLGQTTIAGFNPAKFSVSSFTKCALSTIRKHDIPIDLLYSHFITPAGIATARIGKKLNKPVYIAHGEATLMTIEDFGGPKAVAKELESISGIIAVSAHNKNMLVENHVVGSEKIRIFPNGYNPTRFYVMDKKAARKKLGFPSDKFIVGFVGSYDERKGILRVQQAVDQLDEVVFACAGKGTLIPSSEKCIFKDAVNNSDLVTFYNACDIFALPTRMEGCCNAIVEAVACGLPVISSDRLFNYDVLDDTNSILIDPDDVVALKNAINKLKQDNALREKLHKGSINKSMELTLENRAQNILSYMIN